MKKPGDKIPSRTMEEENQTHREEITDTLFNGKSDICQQLLDRYSRSSAPQHRHLCATAAATRSIIHSELLPFSPLSYFAATIDTISDSAKKSLGADAISALSSFLAIVLPLVPDKAIPPKKAVEAVSLLVELVERPSDVLSTASVRAVVKCLGVLVRFCCLEDWDSLKFGFQSLLKLSLDKRPKVRKCAQDCVLRVFVSFKSADVIKKASKSVYSLLKNHMPLALEISASKTVQGYKDGILPKPEHLEILHMLNVLKHVFPCLSAKVCSKVLLQLKGLISSQFSALTRHIFEVIEVVLENSRVEVMISEAEYIMESLASYVSSEERNPAETTLFATTLFINAFKKLHASESSKWSSHLPLLVGPISGLLTSETSIASLASNILKELIHCLIDRRNLVSIDNHSIDDEATCSSESSAVAATCAVFENILRTCGRMPNEHILAVISVLFLTLGEVSYFYMKNITLKLADMMTIDFGDNYNTKHLQMCIGFAVFAMGPEKVLLLLPISLNVEDLTCSNIWLLPILKDYVIGSTLGFFMEHFVPLAESFQRADRKVKRSRIGEDLQAHAHSCWGLLLAFCRYPTDTHQNFRRLAKLVIPLLKKDSFMLETISFALQELVNQNRSVLGSYQGDCKFAKPPKMVEVKDFATEFERRSSYSKKTASRNIRTLISCSEELFQALTNVFFESYPEKRVYLKEAIGCLASIIDSSISRSAFVSSLKRFHLINDLGECEKVGVQGNASIDEEQSNSTSIGKEVERCLVLELASSFVEGASEDLINLIFDVVKHNLQEADGPGQHEAYHTLSRILEEHSWFCSSKFAELINLLLVLKPPVDIIALRSRFACFRILLVHTLKQSVDEESTKTFLFLNEIILTLKDSKEEGRKVASDVILETSTSLQNSPCAASEGAFQKLISMMLGYLSGSSPHIKSGAVSALSILVYNNANICQLMPDVITSVLTLLESKAIEVIKAVLGFVKVLVSSLQAVDLQNFLSDIVTGILQWSSISRHHFRSKVTVILEIMMRKCGPETINLHAPSRYGDFINSVWENRQGKTKSKEDGTIETEPESSDSSPMGQQKRKHKQLRASRIEECFLGPKRRNTDKKLNGLTSNTKDLRLSAGNVTAVKRVKDVGGSDLDRRNKGKNVCRHLSGGKRKMEQTNASKMVESDVWQASVTFNLAKQRRGGKKTA